MSRIKFSENIFLEVAEMQRFQKFIVDDGYKKILSTFIKTFGIVNNSNNSNFKVYKKLNTTDTIIVNSGLAFNSNLDAILLSENPEYVIPEDDIIRYIMIQRTVSNNEIGTVSILADGTLVGVNTKFLEVLRGLPNYPVKLKFESNINIGEYQVVKVDSDTNALLVGNFTAESDIKYSVIGTFTPGFEPLEENKLIYEYDSCDVQIIESNLLPELTNDQYLLSKIYWDNGTLIIEDLRGNYMFNQTVNTDNNSVNTNIINPLVYWSDIKRIENKRFEILINHGYTISSFELSQYSNYDLLSIKTGSSDWLGGGNIPNGIFNDWLLFNRNNMLFSKIKSNNNKELTLDSLDINMFNGSEELIIIPDFSEIEIEITINSSTDVRKKIYRKFDIINVYNRIDFPINIGSGSVVVKYRMLNSAKVGTKFNSLNFSSINGINGEIVNTTTSTYVYSIEELLTKENYS